MGIKKIALIGTALFVLLLAIVLIQQKGGSTTSRGFAIEFDNDQQRYDQFQKLLEENGISYELEVDHIGRKWVVPDQSKRDEFEQALKIWEMKRTTKELKEGSVEKL